MRLDELVKPKELKTIRQMGELPHNTMLDNIGGAMKQHGFELLGSGVKANVYSHPKYPDSVFKVFDRDKRALQWLTYCNENRNNPFLPKLKSKPLNITANAFYVRMEKLQFDWDYQSKADDFLNYVCEEWRGLKNNEDALLRLKNSYPEYFGFLSDKNFTSAIKTILKISNNDPDIHMGNIMFRGSQLVLTDPV